MCELCRLYYADEDEEEFLRLDELENMVAQHEDHVIFAALAVHADISPTANSQVYLRPVHTCITVLHVSSA